MLEKIQITEREKEILQFINAFGFCEIVHIIKQFSMKQSRCYQVMEKLKRGGLVKHERVFYGRHGIYWVTHKGASYTELPPLTTIPLAHYGHQLTIINLYMKLQNLYPEIRWISERQLIQEKFFDGVGKRGHVADGILVYPDGKKIAIEVELTLKGKNRLQKILKGYVRQQELSEIWYYCAPELIAAIRELTTKMTYIKIHNLAEFLA